MKKIIYLTIFLLQVCSVMNAQVTIGLNGNPEEGAILQLKNKSAVVNGGTNADKGFLLPRVELVALNVLTVVENPTPADKLNHRGTIVYNMTVDEDANLEEGVYKWDGEKWSGFQSTPQIGNAEFTLIEECNKILIAGTYYNEQPLSPNNYMLLLVNVTEPGYYSFFAQAEDGDGNDNGYYFTASGRFVTTGKHEVYLMGSGTPVTPSATGSEDIVYIYSNGTKLETAPNVCCTQSLWIGESDVRPRYAMACNTATVSGVYKKGTSLGATHTITLRLNVSSGSEGATWEVNTNEVEGIRFHGSGVLGAAGSQIVTLYGEGACENSLPKVLTISTNSESNQSTCTVTIVPVATTKTIVEIADDSGTDHGLASGGAWGPKAMLEDPMNYGQNENSIVKCEGFSSIEHSSSTSDANLRRWTGMTAGVDPADIIIYTHNKRPDSSEQVDWLVNYVNKGGVLICIDQDDSDRYNRELLSKIFGQTVNSSDIVNLGSSANLVIKMNSNVNDEIINGPFGDCRLSQWGEDYSNTAGLTFTPQDAIVYSGSVVASTGLISSRNAEVTIMRHKTKNFFWWGDGGAVSCKGEDDTNTGRYPFKVASTTINGVTYPKYPVSKTFGSGTTFPVCNSRFFANVMAWAIKTAEESGINFGK